MALSDSEKAERHRNRLLEKAREYSPDKYKNKYVAPLYQRMIRAEFGAVPSGLSIAVVDGELSHVSRCVGQCVCVTCGVVHAWNAGIKGMHTGHFVGSRRNSVLFEDGNVAPQCANCNYYLGGAPQAFRMWMEAVRGIDVIERLQALRTQVVSFSREELVDMRIVYKRRLDAALEVMKCA